MKTKDYTRRAVDKYRENLRSNPEYADKAEREKARQKQYYLDNKEKIKIRAKAYYQKKKKALEMEKGSWNDFLEGKTDSAIVPKKIEKELNKQPKTVIYVGELLG